MISNFMFWISFFKKSSKRSFIIYLTAILLFSILEIVGLGLLYPLISLFSNDKLDFGSDLLNGLFDQYDITKGDLLFVIASVFLLKFLIQIAIILFKNNFIQNLHASISNKYFSLVLNKKYEYFIETNISRVLNNLQIEVNNIVNHFKSVTILFSEITLLVFTLIILLFFNFNVTISLIFIFSIPIFIYLFSIKNKNKSWGKKRFYIDSTISKIIYESINNIKFLKIFRKESFFIDKFKFFQKQRVPELVKYTSFIEFPRILFELFLVFTIILALYFILISNYDIINFLPLIGVYVATAFKLLPSINKLISSNHNLQFYSDSLKILELDPDEKKEKVIISNFENLEIEKLSFKYENSNLKIFNNANFKIKKNEIVGVIGESGSGKSTLIDIVSGLLGAEIKDLNINSSYKKNTNYIEFDKIGYVSQQTFLTDDSLKNNIAFGLNEDQIDEKKIINLLNLVGLKSLINKGKGLSEIVGDKGVKLSGGQIQRIGIARALYIEPDILILDEPTSALDELSEKKILSILKNLKSEITIIISSHKKSSLSICDRIIRINNGSILNSKT